MEVFGGDAQAIAQAIEALTATNRAGQIDHLTHVVIGPDGAINSAGVGWFDPVFVMRAVDAAADVLEGHEPGPAMAAQVVERHGVFQRDVYFALRDISRLNDRGGVAGLVLVACGPQGVTYSLRGAVPPGPVARSMRQFCTDVAKQSGARRQRLNGLRAALLGEEE